MRRPTPHSRRDAEDAEKTAPLKRIPTGVRVDLYVTPRSSRTSVGGIRDGRLVVRVTAPPLDDAANEAVVLAIAEAFDVPRSRVAIVAGATARMKTVEITGLRAADAASKLHTIS